MVKVINCKSCSFYQRKITEVIKLVPVNGWHLTTDKEMSAEIEKEIKKEDICLFDNKILPSINVANCNISKNLRYYYISNNKKLKFVKNKYEI